MAPRNQKLSTGADATSLGKEANEEVFDAHAQHYSSTIDASLASYGAQHVFFTSHKARLIRRLLRAAYKDPAQMDLLDVGCGVGAIHAFLGADFRSITGVDVSSASIVQARIDFPQHRYLSYDGLRLPIENSSVDMSMAICVFHHVPPEEWEILAREMLRVLRPGGVALVIEHNPWNPVTRRIVNTCPIDRDAVLLTRNTITELLHVAGAIEIVARSMLTVPPVNDLLMGLDSLFGRLPFGAQYYCLAKPGQA